MQISYGQNTLAKVLEKYNDESIPYISVKKLKEQKDNFIIVDARELREYEVSHIKNAIHIGYNFFDIKQLESKILGKEKNIVIYCTTGVRAEDIGEKIVKAGYSNVFNLHGGIFEWKNNSNLVFDENENETESVHVSSSFWSKWLTSGNKVYK